MNTLEDGRSVGTVVCTTGEGVSSRGRSLIDVTLVRDSVTVDIVVTIVDRAVAVSVGLAGVEDSVAVAVRRTTSSVGDRQIGGTGRTVPATHLNVVAVSASHRNGDGGAEVRRGAAIVVGGQTQVTRNRAARGGVVDDQHGVVEASGRTASLDSGVTCSAGGVQEPHVVTHVAVTVGRTVGGGGSVVHAVNTLTHRIGVGTVVCTTGEGIDTSTRLIDVTLVDDSVAVDVVVTGVNRSVTVGIGLAGVHDSVAVAVFQRCSGVGDRQIRGSGRTVPATHLNVVAVSANHRNGDSRAEVR